VTASRPDRRRRVRQVLLLCATAAVAGALTGVLGAAFRRCLEIAEHWRLTLLDWVHTLPGPGWLIPAALVAGCAAVAALVVRWEPFASGSGIPHVEAAFRGDVAPPLLRIVPAKFFGGVVAIGSGLVLGREGPTVHMGAALGAEAARRTRLPLEDVRLMQTALGGAGLAVAFTAPLGGILFVVEEVTRSLRWRPLLATVVATAAAVGCSKLLLGGAPDFRVAAVAAPALSWLPLFAAFGVLTGLLGAAYNGLVLWFLDHVAAVRRIDPVSKAAAIGAVIGLVMVALPLGAGGGDSLTQLILAGHSIAVPLVAGYLLVRFVAGPLSYSAAVPGGLFAPLLAVGALWGLLVAAGVGAVWSAPPAGLALPLALVGMAAFFAGTVRAPLTGVVVVMEMTATTSVWLPMLVASVAAVLAARLVGAPPIYDSLGLRMPPEPVAATDEGPDTI
jgi:chloride channel protein, CIC family